jgi:hypothetical protein
MADDLRAQQQEVTRSLSPVEAAMAKRRDYLQRLQADPFYQFGSAFSRKGDYAGAELDRMAQRDLQTRQQKIVEDRAGREEKAFPAQMLKAQQEILKGGIETMALFQDWAADLPEDKRADFIDKMTPNLTRLLQFGTGSDPDIQPLLNDETVKHLMGSRSALRSVVDAYPDLTPEQKRVVSKMKSEQAVKTADTLAKQNRLEKMEGVKGRVTAFTGGKQPQTFLEVLKGIQATPDERRLIDRWLGENKESLDEIFQRLNVVPLSVEREKMKQDLMPDTAKRLGIGQPVLDQIQAAGVSPSTLSEMPDKERGVLVQKALDTIKSRQVEIAEKTGLAGAEAAETAKRGFPLMPKERSTMIDANELISTGQLVYPPAGATRAKIADDPKWVDIDDKQKEALRTLVPTKTQLTIFQGMAKRLITAQTPSQALGQGLQLHAGAISGANPEAKAYLDATEGFLGLLSRSVGGQKGVLTELDIKQIRRAAIASLFDTASARDYKAAIINDIVTAHHNAIVGEVTGQAMPNRSEVEAMLKKLDASTTDTVGRIPETDRPAAFIEIKSFHRTR